MEYRYISCHLGFHALLFTSFFLYLPKSFFLHTIHSFIFPMLLCLLAGAPLSMWHGVAMMMGTGRLFSLTVSPCPSLTASKQGGSVLNTEITLAGK